MSTNNGDDNKENLCKVIDTTYKYLIEEGNYELSDITGRLDYWLERIEIVVKDCGLWDKVTVNKTALYYFICDYFADILRLKEFHPVEKANLKKILSYGAYWFIRKHPVNFIVDEVLEDQLYINEKIAMSAILSSVAEWGNVTLNENVIKNLFYNLKYRVFTAQSLELFIDGLLRGEPLEPKINNNK